MDNWNLKVSLREAKETRSEKAAKIPIWKIYFEVGEWILSSERRLQSSQGARRRTRARGVVLTVDTPKGYFGCEGEGSCNSCQQPRWVQGRRVTPRLGVWVAGRMWHYQNQKWREIQNKKVRSSVSARLGMIWRQNNWDYVSGRQSDTQD